MTDPQNVALIAALQRIADRLDQIDGSLMLIVATNERILTTPRLRKEAHPMTTALDVIALATCTALGYATTSAAVSWWERWQTERKDTQR
jgi:hypothetical protein